MDKAKYRMTVVLTNVDTNEDTTLSIHDMGTPKPLSGAIDELRIRVDFRLKSLVDQARANEAKGS